MEKSQTIENIKFNIRGEIIKPDWFLAEEERWERNNPIKLEINFNKNGKKDVTSEYYLECSICKRTIELFDKEEISLTNSYCNMPSKGIDNSPCRGQLKLKTNSITNCPFIKCALNSGNGGCISTNTIQCTEIPDNFNDDKR